MRMLPAWWITDDNCFRNSSSSDDEPRHTPSPPGPNPHRVKRCFFVIMMRVIIIMIIIVVVITAIFIIFLSGLSLDQLTMRKTSGLSEKSWRKRRTRQLTNGKLSLLKSTKYESASLGEFVWTAQEKFTGFKGNCSQWELLIIVAPLPSLPQNRILNRPLNPT